MIVGDGREIGLGEDLGERPGLAAVVGEGEVRSVLVGMFVITSGDDAVKRVAESDGKDAGGIGAVEDRGVEDLPGASAVGGVEDAGSAASGGEPDIGIGG